MMNQHLRFVAALPFCMTLMTGADAAAQSNDLSSRIRPLGSPSAVDQYRKPQVMRPAAAAANPVRQTAWMQSPGGMGFPGTLDMSTAPPSSVMATPTPDAPVPTPSLPNTVPYPEASSSPQPVSPIQPEASRALPPPPITASNPVPSPSDQTPIAAPQLDTGGYATVDNCHLVTGPSTYNAYADCGCGQVLPTSYNSPRTTAPPPVFSPGTVPTEIAAPAVMPPAAPVASAPIAGVPVAGAPVVAAPPAAIVTPAPKPPPRAVISFGQNQNPVQIGQGLWGQPVAYVPGQKCRNWVRYIFP